MKWYWILLIVLVAIAAGVLIAKAMGKKGASLPAITRTVINSSAAVDKPAATQTTVTV